jgi:hypothetical protein
VTYQKTLPRALLVFALDCGGRSGLNVLGATSAQTGDDATAAGGLAETGSSSSGVVTTGGAASSGSGSSSDGGSPSGSGSGSSSGSSSVSESRGDAGTAGTFDAETPDAFPASCAHYPLLLDPDAAPNTCAFTPADVACDANADCTQYVVTHCGCGVDPVYGVNTANTIGCAPSQCPPPQGGCSDDPFGLYTQDCQVVPHSQNVAVACVNHQCTTFAVGLK